MKTTNNNKKTTIALIMATIIIIIVGAADYAIGGTTNYIPVFTDSDTINNSVIVQNGTNIGIGTSTATQKLSVVGNIMSQKSTNTTDGYFLLFYHPTDLYGAMRVWKETGYSEIKFQLQNSTSGSLKTPVTIKYNSLTVAGDINITKNLYVGGCITYNTSGEPVTLGVCT